MSNIANWGYRNGCMGTPPDPHHFGVHVPVQCPPHRGPARNGSLKHCSLSSGLLHLPCNCPTRSAHDRTDGGERVQWMRRCNIFFGSVAILPCQALTVWVAATTPQVPSWAMPGLGVHACPLKLSCHSAHAVQTFGTSGDPPGDDCNH
jgi:hypothetical protein